MRRLAMTCVLGYQRFISPFIPAHCRFTPTCSEYMLTAIQHYGTSRGLWLGLKRLGRCHPFGSHGYDPVPGCSPETHQKELNIKEPIASQSSGSHNNPGDCNG